MNLVNSLKQAKTIRFSNNPYVSFKDISLLLQKEKQQRQKSDVKVIGKYLSDHYDYFRKLKETSEHLKYEKIISALSYESYKAQKSIIDYGVIPDKAYVLLKGKVGVYKTTDINKQMSYDDFEQYANHIKDKEDNHLKYKRILLKNDHINLFSLFSYGNQILNCTIEQEELIGTFKDGFSFGDSALSSKTPMNETIKALESCILVSIDQYNYNEIQRELEDKSLEKTFDGFKTHFQVFKYWSNKNLLALLNSFQHLTLIHGEFLFKQNEDSDALYLVRSGSFDVSSTVYFDWVGDFINYIVYSKSNLVYHTKDIKKHFDNNTVRKMFNAIKNINRDVIEASPCRLIQKEVMSMIQLSKTPRNDSILQLKLNEDKVIQQSINIKLRKVDKPEMLGFEDSIELKKRFTTAKCISTEAKVDKIPLYEFFRIASNIKELDRKMLLHLIAEQKMCLVSLIKNAVQSKAQELESISSNQYSAFINNDNIHEGNKCLALNFQRTNTSLSDFVSIKPIKNKVELSEVSKPKKVTKLVVSSDISLFPSLLPNSSCSTLIGKNETNTFKQSSLCSSTRILWNSQRLKFNKKLNTSLEGSTSMKELPINKGAIFNRIIKKVQTDTPNECLINVSSSPGKGKEITYPMLFANSNNNTDRQLHSTCSIMLTKKCFLSSAYKKILSNYKKFNKDMIDNTKSISEEDIKC